MYALLSLVLALLCTHAATPENTIVSTTTGLVQGITRTSDIAFYGIPYAEPPLGRNRFRPPQVKLPWSGILDATMPKPSCIQSPKTTYGMQEDCLILNVFVPLNNQSNLPVMFWIHGGGFVTGSALGTEPAAIVARGVVVVSINYRLGPLGYLQSRLIQQENPSFPTLGGMNGVADQILALRWTKQNAKAFGGDPDQITIFGESAGGLSVCEIMVSPLSSGLFKRAIIESGGCVGPWEPKTADFALSVGVQFMQEFGAKSLDDLRNIPATSFWNSSYVNQLGPAVDNYVLSQLPINYFESHKLQLPSDGAVIVGSNSLDSINAEPPFPETPADYEAVLKKFFVTDAPEVLQYYPAGSSPAITFQILNCHLCIACPDRLLAEAVSATNPAYLYEFSYNPVAGDYYNMAAHAAEVGLVFGYAVPPFQFNAQLSKQMIDYWTSFAKTGIPSSVVTWPQFASAVPPLHQDLNAVISAKSGFYDEKCGFWKNYVARGALQLKRTMEYCYQRVDL